jgi:hypothetical protein
MNTLLPPYTNAELMVGLEKETYTATEGEEIKVCALIFNSTLENRDFKVNFHLKIGPLDISGCIEKRSQRGCAIVPVEKNTQVERPRSVPVWLYSNDTRIAIANNGSLEISDPPNGAVIRFESPVLTVDESEGLTSVCAVVESAINGVKPLSECPVSFDFNISFTTRNQSAVVGSDFNVVINTLFFGACQRQACENILILDDCNLEEVEVFGVVLQELSPKLDTLFHVSSDPLTVTVTESDTLILSLDEREFIFSEDEAIYHCRQCREYTP